jgi:hypothetical protein
MKRLALTILVVVACGGKGKPETSSHSGIGSAAVYAKKLVVTWGTQPKGSSADVFLQTTDETGKQVSYPLGTYDGECKVIKPAEEMKAVSGVNCTAGNKGTELHAVVTETEIVVLKLAVEIGLSPDPMSRVEVTRVKAPGGAAIEAGT